MVRSFALPCLYQSNQSTCGFKTPSNMKRAFARRAVKDSTRTGTTNLHPVTPGLRAGTPNDPKEIDLPFETHEHVEYSGP